MQILNFITPSLNNITNNKRTMIMDVPPSSSPTVTRTFVPSAAPPAAMGDELPIFSKMASGCALYDLLVCGVVVGVSCALGLLGNAAAVVVLRADDRRRGWGSVTALLLTALAAADSAFLLPIAALTVPAAFCRFRPAWCSSPATLTALRLIDRYGWAVASMAHTLTVYVTVLVTWQRYVAVCRPHAAAAALPAKTLMLARRRIGAIVVFAVIYNLPRFLEFDVAVTIEHEFATVMPIGSAQRINSKLLDVLLLNNSGETRDINSNSNGSMVLDHRISWKSARWARSIGDTNYSNQGLLLNHPRENQESLAYSSESPLIGFTLSFTHSPSDLQKDIYSTQMFNGNLSLRDFSELPDNMTYNNTSSLMSVTGSANKSGNENATTGSGDNIPGTGNMPKLVVRRTWLRTTRVLTQLGRSPWYQIIYKNICFYIFIYVIPLITLVVLTSRLAQALRKRKLRFHSRGGGGGGTAQRGREDGTTLVLIVVVLVFIVCQTPTLFQRLFYAVFGDAGLRCGHFFFYFERLSDYFAVLNSCVNFIIYIMFSHQFRQVLRRSLRRRGAGRKTGRKGQGGVDKTQQHLIVKAAWSNGHHEHTSNGDLGESLGSVV